MIVINNKEKWRYLTIKQSLLTIINYLIFKSINFYSNFKINLYTVYKIYRKNKPVRSTSKSTTNGM